MSTCCQSPNASNSSHSSLSYTAAAILIDVSAGVLCRFGSATVSATARGNGYARCIAPPTSEPKVVSVEISLNNGGDFSSYGAQWAYMADANVAAVDPTWGGATGGTAVRVTGGPFPPETSSFAALACKFGSSAVPATWVSQSELSCTSPPVVAVPEVQTVHVSALAFAPQVVQIDLTADPPANEVHVLATHNAPVSCCYTYCSPVA
jgi:IPT/TIG domain